MGLDSVSAVVLTVLFQVAQRAIRYAAANVVDARDLSEVVIGSTESYDRAVRRLSRVQEAVICQDQAHARTIGLALMSGQKFPADLTLDAQHAEVRTRRSVLGWCLCVISMAECAALAGDVERVRDQLSTDLTYRPDY